MDDHMEQSTQHNAHQHHNSTRHRKTFTTDAFLPPTPRPLDEASPQKLHFNLYN